MNRPRRANTEGNPTVTTNRQGNSITAGMALPIIFANGEGALLPALELFETGQAYGVVYFDEWPGKPGYMFIRVYLRSKYKWLRKRIIRDTKKLVRDLGFVALDGEPQGDV